MKLTIGIDASRNRSGEANAHPIGILTAFYRNPLVDVKEVHIWSYNSLLHLLPDYAWLEKLTHVFFLRKILFFRCFGYVLNFPMKQKKEILI